MGLADYLEPRRARVEQCLAAYLRLEAGLPASLLEAMRYSLLAPGKRLRPLLVVMAAEACGGADDVPWPAACAVEMIHAYSLIHDDLPAMDDDDLRRGQPTCHKKFGEALAILAGDALQALAFQVLADGYPAETAAAACRTLARAAGMAGMVGGQTDDLAWEAADAERNVHTLENLHGRKTGALIRAALQLGVFAGHAAKDAPPAALLDRFDAFGKRLGLLFQITDDLLDVEGHADQTGKRVQKDAARGKLTYPGLLGVAGSRARAEQLCQEARDLMQPLGGAASPLAALALYVLERDR
ncbi:MAG TPA: farnesyl diphosphate synthase [Pirellulales bacterium]|nr:farnesyl diphosphate synthase [Pirellulales bacterium]